MRPPCLPSQASWSVPGSRCRRGGAWGRHFPSPGPDTAGLAGPRPVGGNSAVTAACKEVPCSVLGAREGGGDTAVSRPGAQVCVKRAGSRGEGQTCSQHLPCMSSFFMTCQVGVRPGLGGLPRCLAVSNLVVRQNHHSFLETQTPGAQPHRG